MLGTLYPIEHSRSLYNLYIVYIVIFCAMGLVLFLVILYNITLYNITLYIVIPSIVILSFVILYIVINTWHCNIFIHINFNLYIRSQHWKIKNNKNQTDHMYVSYWWCNYRRHSRCDPQASRTAHNHPHGSSFIHNYCRTSCWKRPFTRRYVIKLWWFDLIWFGTFGNWKRTHVIVVDNSSFIRSYLCAKTVK